MRGRAGASFGAWVGGWALALCALVASVCDAAEQRFAVVIGNQSYSGSLSTLVNPGGDAQRMEQALRATGFATTGVRRDLNRAQIFSEVRALADRLKKAGPDAVGFFYYSGHGASVTLDSRRRNYLIPIGAQAAKADDLVAEGVPLDEVVAILATAKSKAVFVVFDACRNELPWSKGGDDPDKAFGAVPGRSGLLLAYATAEGYTAPDDGAFSRALAAEMVRPGLEHFQVFRNASRAVGRSRATERLPWFNDQVDGSIVFASAVTPSPGVGARPVVADPAPVGDAPAKPAPPPPATASLPDARRLPASSPAPVLPSGQSPGNFAAFRDCADCLEMVALPGDSFTMGSASGETGRDDDEAQVDIALGRFAISRFPVTRGQYAAFATATGRGTSGGCRTDRATKGSWADDPQGSWADPAFAQTDRHPVVCVNWDDANAFTRWMSERTGKSYRLLSEAEYEYANRGGTTTPYWWGYDGNGGCGSANGLDATAKRGFPDKLWTFAACDDGYERTSPVGAFSANPFGLFDTTGNVLSWTADCYNTASAARPRDGRPDTSGDCSSRVLRGGSWSIIPQDLRSAIRFRINPSSPNNSIGFRLARTVSPSDR